MQLALLRIQQNQHTSRFRIRRLIREGNTPARQLYQYLENPEDFLWTILVGNTLANFAVVCLGVQWLFGALWQTPWALFEVLVIGVLVFILGGFGPSVGGGFASA